MPQLRSARLQRFKRINDAPKQLNAAPERYRHGKTMLKGVREEFRSRNGKSLMDAIAHPSLAVPSLQVVAKKAFGTPK